MLAGNFVLGEVFRVDAPASRGNGPGHIVELSGGRFVIGYDSTWQSDLPVGTMALQIIGPTGQNIGPDYRITDFPYDQVSLASLRALPGGGFVAVWDGLYQNSWITSAQRFDDAGQKVGDVLFVNILPVGSPPPNTVDLVPLDDGNFLLVSNGSLDGAITVTGRIITAQGGLGVPFDLDGTASGTWQGHVEQASDGSFVASWLTIGANNDTDCMARVFNADGSARGAAFALHNPAPGDQRQSQVAFFADGSFVAVWTSSLNGRQDVFAQRFDAQGTRVGGQFMVNVTDNTYNDYPDVAVLADQSFVVTWQRPSYSYNAQGFLVNRGYGATAQTFASDGTPIASQVWIDDTNYNRYTGPSIEALDNGGYVVTWLDLSGEFSSLHTLDARIFGPNSAPVFTSPSAVSVAENTTFVLQLQASDPDVNARLSYTVSGGPDAQYFSVDPRGSGLSFRNPAPDYEDPVHGPIYTVQVAVWDGHTTAYQTLTVTVTDVREAVNLIGTPEADTLIGTEFADSLAGLGGADILIGGDQDDYLDGGAGADLLYGGAGSDTYAVDEGDLVFEAAGEGDLDRVFAGSSFYLFANLEVLYLDEGAGNAFGVGNDLNNILFGNSGDNLLIGNGGADSILGGDGNDALFGGDGDDTLIGEAGIDYLAGGDGADTLYGYGDADALHGEAGDDVLWAGEGFVTDILTGGDGNDELHADSGEGDYDLIAGGAGNDTYWVDTGDDKTFEALDGGVDTVIANVPGANNGVYLYPNVENLVLEGATAFGVGNELANRLTGSASANWLLGGAGDDTIEGGAGDDVLFGEAGADRFVFAPGSGADLLGDFQAGTDTIDLSAYNYDWAGIQAAMGQVGSDTFINLLNGDVLVFSGVSMSQLQENSFIL